MKELTDMDDYSAGSIHDMMAAPEAPDAASLTDLSNGSPRSPRRASRGRMGSEASLEEELRRHSTGGRMDLISENIGSLLPRRMSSPTVRNNDDDLDNSIAFDRHSSTSPYEDEEQMAAENLEQQQVSRRGILPFICGPFVNRMSNCVVRNAPCFWCCGGSLSTGATDRDVLYRVNLLCAFFALAQIGAGCFLLTVLYSNLIVERKGAIVQRQGETSNPLSIDLWNLNGSVVLMGVVASILFGTVLYTLHIVRQVNLRGAVRYLWTLVWLSPLQIFFVISLFDYHRVTHVWVRHWWYLESMAWFRLVFCAPETYNSMCMVPVNGGSPQLDSEEAWCSFYYPQAANATECTEIRDAAQNRVNSFLYMFFTGCGVWGVVMVCLLLFAMSLLENIITRPIVQTSRESNVPGWLLLPIVGCFTAGVVLLFSPSSVISGSAESSTSNWVGVLYVICGGCFYISATLGWFIGKFSILNSADKRNKNLAVIFFIAMNALNLMLLAAIFSGSVFISTSIVDVPLSDSQVGRAACDIDTADSCSNCGNRFGDQECPEWTKDEVVKVLKTQYKSSATFAAIFMIYALNALRYGISLRKHISLYQIDYV